MEPKTLTLLYAAFGGQGLLNVSFWRQTYTYPDRESPEPGTMKSCVDFKRHLSLFQYGDNWAWCWNERGYDGPDHRWSAGPFGSVTRQDH